MMAKLYEVKEIKHEVMMKGDLVAVVKIKEHGGDKEHTVRIHSYSDPSMARIHEESLVKWTSEFTNGKGNAFELVLSAPGATTDVRIGECPSCGGVIETELKGKSIFQKCTAGFKCPEQRRLRYRFILKDMGFKGNYKVLDKISIGVYPASWPTLEGIRTMTDIDIVAAHLQEDEFTNPREEALQFISDMSRTYEPSVWSLLMTEGVRGLGTESARLLGLDIAFSGIDAALASKGVSEACREELFDSITSVGYTPLRSYLADQEDK